MGNIMESITENTMVSTMENTTVSTMVHMDLMGKSRGRCLKINPLLDVSCNHFTRYSTMKVEVVVYMSKKIVSG